MKPIITVENLGKKYTLGQTHVDLLSEKMGTMFRSLLRTFRGDGRSVPASGIRIPPKQIWALKDLNVEISQGEVVGIVGRNGAGKSTFLKVLSRITDPTEGRILIEGRVASLLEVGTGFHPELTGRENIFLNGAILGMSRAEIRSKFDEIVSFSEIEQFLDTPVKRYSSGMYVRLAFSVAAHLDPEILIVDEVLAVGDHAFQKKCLGKMHDVSRGGKTVLFVSHNMTAIRDLCSRAIWLESGSCVSDGETNQVVSKYIHETSAVILERKWADLQAAPGNDIVRLLRARLTSSQHTPYITVRTPLDVEFWVLNRIPNQELSMWITLFNLDGTCVFETDSDVRSYGKGFIRAVCHIPGDFLNDGTYRVKIWVDKGKDYSILQYDEALVFEVQDVEREGTWHGKWPGAVRPKLKWETEFVEENDWK